MMVYPNWTMSPTRPATYIPILATLVCLAVLWQNRNRWARPLLFGLGYFAVVLFPILGFFHQSYHAFSRVADQWLYPAQIGLLALIAAAAVNLWRRASPNWRYAELTAALAVVFFLSLLTRARTYVFASEETLWRDTANKNPTAWIAFNNLGVALAGHGRLDQAIQNYQRAIQLKPDYTDAYDGLGNVFSAQQKYDQAIANYQHALQITPADGDAHEHLAETYWQQGNPQAAIIQWNQALQLQPDSPNVLNNFAWALAVTDPSQGGDPPRTVALAQFVCQLTDNADPTFPDTLSVALAATGQFPAAVNTAQTALNLARAAGNTDLAKKIQTRLTLFRNNQPYHPSNHS